MNYNGSNSYLFLNGTDILKFKPKESDIAEDLHCLGNISKDFSTDNMNQTGLYRYVYDFSVDYNTILVHDILDIHKYLMKKNNIV